ncbi:MAG: ABC transporter permease, partial [Pseudomonadota bacterium]
MIAWRYLRARRAEGGVSVMTWISLIGIALAVFALIATLSVRAGFRAEFVDTILGANAHATYYSAGRVDELGNYDRSIPDYTEVAARLAEVPGVTGTAPLVVGQVLASEQGRNAGAQVIGITAQDLAALPRIIDDETGFGDIARFGDGVAIGAGIARSLGLSVGDTIRLISPDGAKTAFGTSPRTGIYEIVYVFSAGRYDIEQVRIYMPFAEAQSYFNRDGVADQIEIRLAGYIARAMGLPIDRLVVATNHNDILDRALRTGQYTPSGVAPSISPSMDIQVSSNFERALFDAYGRDGAAVRQLMAELAQGGFSISQGALESLRDTFASGRADETQTSAM